MPTNNIIPSFESKKDFTLLVDDPIKKDFYDKLFKGLQLDRQLLVRLNYSLVDFQVKDFLMTLKELEDFKSVMKKLQKLNIEITPLSEQYYLLSLLDDNTTDDGFDRITQLPDIRIAVLGNVDAGKSTTMGVLCRGTLDDGRGLARSAMFRHTHERESGRTSSVGQEIVGVRTGKLIQDSNWTTIILNSIRVLTIVDLAGHERYLRTTAFGMTGYAPDASILLISANNGSQLGGMAREHLALALCLHLPLAIIITKIDQVPGNVKDTTLKSIQKALKAGHRQALRIKTVDEVCAISNQFGRKITTPSTSTNTVAHSSNTINTTNTNVNSTSTTPTTSTSIIAPIFEISNVTGEGHDLLALFLSLLKDPSTDSMTFNQNNVEFTITETYSVPGVGTVLSGNLHSGIVHSNSVLLLGPDASPSGKFIKVQVRTLQWKRTGIEVVKAPACCAIAIKKIKKSSVRKGSILISLPSTLSTSMSLSSSQPIIIPPLQFLNSQKGLCREFEADVMILFHSTTISEKYQAMLHCGIIRQTVHIVCINNSKYTTNQTPSLNNSSCPSNNTISTNDNDDDTLTSQHNCVMRTGDRGRVRFRFARWPEWMAVGQRLLFREGKTKGVGRVVSIDSMPIQISTQTQS